jgi:hypothetical protein
MRLPLHLLKVCPIGLRTFSGKNFLVPIDVKPLLKRKKA